MPVELFAVLLPPALQHLGMLLQFALGLQELLAKLWIELEKLPLACSEEISDEIWWVNDHLDDPWLHRYRN